MTTDDIKCKAWKDGPWLAQLFIQQMLVMDVEREKNRLKFSAAPKESVLQVLKSSQDVSAARLLP